jgi:beta-lactamase superfamily II metal-dependent hydrolase
MVIEVSSSKRQNSNMFLIIVFLIVVCICLVFLVKNYQLNKIIQNYVKEVSASIENVDGIEITMLGESNMKDSGDINSCGYIIKTKNNKLIIVDGGRDIDSEIVLEYINDIGNGTVDYWFVTHPHADHIGALIKLLETEDITIKNLCYSFNSLEWYEQYDARGVEAETSMINDLSSEKIVNKIEGQKGQVIDIDNVRCDILRGANPEITNSNNGNESSMVFKLTATDVDKSIIFLGDIAGYASLELLENPEELKADVVQMAHHGQGGATEAVYKAINPKICCFNAPEWLYNNDSGEGYNTGNWQSITVRSWVENLGAKSLLAYEGNHVISLLKMA